MSTSQQDYAAFVEQSLSSFLARQEALQRSLGLDGDERLRWEAGSGEMRFTLSDGATALSARFQVIGSLSLRSGQWLWAWDNPSLADELKQAARELREFGRERGFERLMNAKWRADEQDGWDMVALATQVLDAPGAYRMRTPHGYVYVVLTSIERQEPRARAPLPAQSAAPAPAPAPRAAPPPAPAPRAAPTPPPDPAPAGRPIKTERAARASKPVPVDPPAPLRAREPDLDEAQGTAIVCACVLEEQRPILTARRDLPVKSGDSGWQFLCGASGHRAEHGRAEPIESIVGRDPSLKPWMAAPAGTSLRRRDPSSAWVPAKR